MKKIPLILLFISAVIQHLNASQSIIMNKVKSNCVINMPFITEKTTTTTKRSCVFTTTTKRSHTTTSRSTRVTKTTSSKTSVTTSSKTSVTTSSKTSVTTSVTNSTMKSTTTPTATIPNKNLTSLGNTAESFQMMSYFNARNLSQSQMSILKTLLTGSCWRDSYTRGAGESISDCDANEDKDGALCYPKCEEGYVGNGPVCWEKCKEGFTDRGVFCIIDLYVYGKGCCCIAGGYCCNNCPANFTDDGCTCRRPPKSYSKKSYGRGAGVPLKCKANYEINGALCYPICQEGYSGAGPVCWKNCVEPLATDCAALCTLSESTCAFKSFNLVYLLGVPFKTMLYWVSGPTALVNLESLYNVPTEYAVPKCF